MIRSRLPRTLLLATLALALALGCSSRKGKVLGNERLLRGEEGLGNTTRTFAAPDRDTYVSMGEANLGQTLIVGIEPSRSFEARAFFRRPDRVMLLPDTLDPSVAILSMTFEVPIDVNARNDGSALSVALATTNGKYDPTKGWSGPAQEQTLGVLLDASAAPFRIELPFSAYTDIQDWAKADTLALVLYPTGGSGIIGLEAGKATLSIVYQYDTGGGVLDTTTVVTSFPDDHYLHPSPSPSPTGSDTTLVLGGLFELGVPLRFPVTAVPEGSTVNEATLLLRVDAVPPFFASDQKAPLLVRRLPGAWPESATDTTQFSMDTAVYATSDSIAVRSAADSVLSIALPLSIIRQWTAAGAINEGLLVTVANANRLPEIRIGSRESSRPAELRVSITTPPPGRF